MKLMKHQVEALSWGEQHSKKIYALDMGLGKSCISLKTVQKGERVLIICPATLKINWEIEVKLWTNIKNITIIKKKSEEISKKPGVYIVNYDLLGSKVKKRAKPNFDFKDFDRVIIDECHMIKNPKAVRTKIAGRIVKTTPNAVLLSGTLMERPIDLYVPLFSIGALDMSYNSFGMKYCDPQKIYLGNREVWQFRGSSDPIGLNKILKKQTLIMYKENVIDLPLRSISVVALDLPVGRQEKNYSFTDIMKDPRPIGFEGLAELLHEQALRKLPLAVKHIKMRLEDNFKIFITARHTDVIEILMDKLLDYGCVKLDGSCSAKQKQWAVDTFQNNKNCRIFVGQTKASGVGITLTAASHVILVEPDWSYSAIMQIVDRLHRIGQKNNVTAELLTIHDSIDERVLYTTLEKKGFIKEIMK